MATKPNKNAQDDSLGDRTGQIVDLLAQEIADRLGENENVEAVKVTLTIRKAEFDG